MTTEQFMLLCGILMCIIIYLSAKLYTIKYFNGTIIGKNQFIYQNEFKLVVKYNNKSVKTKEIKVDKTVFDKYKEGDEITIALYNF